MRGLCLVAVGSMLLHACGGNSKSAGSGSGGGGPSHSLTLHVKGQGAGTIQSDNPRFDCAAAQCTQAIADGAAVRLVATPSAGSIFGGWQGACSGNAGCNLDMDSDKDVTAIFQAAGVVVDVQFTGDGAGRVTSAPAGIDCVRSPAGPASPVTGTCSLVEATGQALVIQVVPEASSGFIGWGGACSGNGGCSISAPGAHTVWVHLEPKGPPPPPAGSCTGISPPAVVPMRQFVSEKQPVVCSAGTGDARGTLAFLRFSASPNSHADVTQFVATGGTVLGAGSTNEGSRNFPQPVGISTFAGSPHLGPQERAQLVNFDSAGKEAGSTVLFSLTAQPRLAGAAFPDGGMLIAGDFAPMGNTQPPAAGGPVQHAVAKYSGSGTVPAVVWGPKILASSGAVLGAGVDLAGRALVVTDGGAGTVSGQWFDADGTPMTDVFLLASGFTPGALTSLEATPLVGAGLLVQRIDGFDTGSHATAVAVVASGAATVQPPAAWITGRPDARFLLARARSAYAVLPLGAKGVSCTQSVEIVAPDGRSCGKQDYKIADGACDTHDMTLALDGTLIQRLPDSMEARDEILGGETCTWRWFTGAVR